MPRLKRGMTNEKSEAGNRAAKDMKRFHLNQDVFAGLAFMVFGGFFLYFGREYPVGTTLNMGPGYFPMLLSWLVIGLGALVAIKGVLTKGEKLEGWAVRPSILINATYFVFALIIEDMGLFVTALLISLIAAVAGSQFKLREQVVLSISLAL